MRKIILLAILSVIMSACGGEREGTIDYSDCRQVVTLASDNLQQFYKTFTCNYLRRKSGKIVGGSCVHVDTYSGGLFGSNSGKCETAYIYYIEAKPDPGCSKDYPYKGANGLCYSLWTIADDVAK